MIINNMFVVCINRVAPFTVRVEVEGATLSMEIDTGAALSLISETTYSQLWPEGRAHTLEKSPIRLRTYTGEELKLVGKTMVKVCVENQEEVVDLLVVEGSRPNLLNRDWLPKIQLNWKEIHKVHTKQFSLEEILTDHSSLFKDELGTIKCTSAKLHINPDARPRFFRPRSVPYALQIRVNQALEKLQTEDVIELVEFSKWAAQFVPVVKWDDTILAGT